MESNGLHAPQQSGFWTEFCSHTTILKSVNDIKEAMSRDQITKNFLKLPRLIAINSTRTKRIDN